MTTTAPFPFGSKRDDFVSECCRSLSARLTTLFGAPVTAEPSDPAAALMQGAGVMVTGRVTGAEGGTRVSVFLSERTALDLAGALRGSQAANLDEAINALSPFGGAILVAVAAGAGAAVPGKHAGTLGEIVRIESAPAPGIERVAIALKVGESSSLVSIEMSHETGEVESQRPSQVLLDLELPFALTLGSVELELGQIQQLDPGAVIPLSRAADSAASLVVGGRVVARGGLVVVDGRFGIRVESVETEERRLKSVARA